MALVEMNFAEGGGSNLSGFITNLPSATILSAVASSTYADSRFTVDHSYDNDSTTAWLPNALGNNVPYNVVYDLGSKQDIYAAFIQWACSEGSVYNTDVGVSVSDDGTNFTNVIPSVSIDVQNPWSAQGSSLPKQGNIAILNQKCRYVKLSFSRNSGNSSYCVGIGEIKFLLNS